VNNKERVIDVWDLDSVSNIVIFTNILQVSSGGEVW
jgi:hypothetical protein